MGSMTRGQRALLKFWREAGIVEKYPPKLIGEDGKPLCRRSWVRFFEAMDAYNLMAFHFNLEDVFDFTTIATR